jgi:hypothetical protein
MLPPLPPPAALKPLQVIPAGTTSIKVIGTAKTELEPMDVSILSPEQRIALGKHNLDEMSWDASKVYYNIIWFFSIFFNFAWGFGQYLWALTSLSMHKNAFENMPRTEGRPDMVGLLSWIRYIPLFNLLIIPYSQDELRRWLNLQCAIRGYALTFSRNYIWACSITMSLGFLSLLVGSYSFIFQELFVETIVQGWLICFPNLLIAIIGIYIVTVAARSSENHWWPTKPPESKTGLDLLETTITPLILTYVGIMIGISTLAIFSVGVDSLVFVSFFLACSLIFNGLSRGKTSAPLLRRVLISITILAFFMIFYVLKDERSDIGDYDFYLMIFGICMIFFGLCFSMHIDNIIGSVLNELKGGKMAGNQTPTASPAPPPSLAPAAHAQTITTQMQNHSTSSPITTTPIGDPTALENFTRKQLIAQGGMSDVYMATDTMSGKDVAWKEAHNRFNPLQVTNEKLRGEAELLQMLNHQRLPKFIALGEVSNDSGSTCGVLIEEFIEGGDLKSTVEQVNKMGMNLPTAKIIELMSQICEPLIHMTRLAEPVYHRDLKPHNIIVHPQRGPVLIDFGLAKMVASGEDVSITRGGSGTWSPPERDSGISGPFTDVYSLGKILFYIATGQQPPTIMTHAEKDGMIAMNHPEWLANLMLSAAWPRHDDRLLNVHMFTEGLANEGRIRQSSQDVAASDDFTTWG